MILNLEVSIECNSAAQKEPLLTNADYPATREEKLEHLSRKLRYGNDFAAGWLARHQQEGM